tara:strand:+ start:98 stop:1180 length:1083 start_codon:yes stop_codon:yes gene_type:complete
MLDRKDKVLAALVAVRASTNHYELLLASDIEREGTGIEQWAKKVQRALTLLLHPDTCSKLALGREVEKAATEAFQEMQAAFDVLSDESRRSRYDDELARQVAEREAAAAQEANAASKREQEEAARRREAEEAARRDRYHAELRRLCTNRKERERAEVAAENRVRIKRFEENERARRLSAAQATDSGEAATACRFVHAATGLQPSKPPPRVPPGRMAALCGHHRELTRSSAGAASSASAPATVPATVPPGRMAGLCAGVTPAAGAAPPRGVAGRDVPRHDAKEPVAKLAAPAAVSMAAADELREEHRPGAPPAPAADEPAAAAGAAPAGRLASMMAGLHPAARSKRKTKPGKASKLASMYG